jgi:hypothetical protein
MKELHLVQKRFACLASDWYLILGSFLACFRHWRKLFFLFGENEESKRASERVREREREQLCFDGFFLLRWPYKAAGINIYLIY